MNDPNDHKVGAVKSAKAAVSGALLPRFASKSLINSPRAGAETHEPETFPPRRPWSAQAETPPSSGGDRWRTPFFGWMVEVWSYAAVLGAILIGVGWLFSGSLELLPVIVFVCIAGGVVGTVLAALRSVQERKNGAYSLNYYERRIIR